MTYRSISPKQAEIFRFPHEDYDALICDGAVRSGKTSMMMIAFVEWAMHTFNGHSLGVCGKTVQSAERNIMMPLLSTVSMNRKYLMKYTRSTSTLTVEYRGRVNYFIVFGGKDERSYQLIQGITLAGVLFDEVALMPRSFVEQGITRTLSIDDAKLWFSCNPESPDHWFYLEWIQQPEKHRAKHLHFLMTDNPSLTDKAIARSSSSFSGVFYDRYILGVWVKAEGLIYPMFDQLKHTFTDESAPQSGIYYISIDYGTMNPFAAHLWCVSGQVAYCMAEFYYDGRDTGRPLTDEEYLTHVLALAGKFPVVRYIIDPSAASFIQCMRRRGIPVSKANNDVVSGISNTASALEYGRVRFHEGCKNTIREFGLYAWDEKAADDKPIKDNDHAMDSVRYFVRTILNKQFFMFDKRFKAQL